MLVTWMAIMLFTRPCHRGIQLNVICGKKNNVQSKLPQFVYYDSSFKGTGLQVSKSFAHEALLAVLVQYSELLKMIRNMYNPGLPLTEVEVA
jgi:hypothetical protein